MQLELSAVTAFELPGVCRQGRLQPDLLHRRRVKVRERVPELVDGARERSLGACDVALLEILLRSGKQLECLVVQVGGEPGALGLLRLERLLQQAGALLRE